ncbi:hypothetical protein MMT24_33860, partial [Escherichia coli]|nr:hypothetical protein [Escherichia coli]
AGRLEDESARAGTASLSGMKKSRAINPAFLRWRFPVRKSGISITIYGDYAMRPSIIFATAEYVKRLREECLRE